MISGEYSSDLRGILVNPNQTWLAAVAKTVGSTNSSVARSTHGTRVYSHLAPLPPPPFFPEVGFLFSLLPPPSPITRSLVPLPPGSGVRTQWSHFRISPVPQGRCIHIRVCAFFFSTSARRIRYARTIRSFSIAPSNRPVVYTLCRLISKTCVFSVLHIKPTQNVYAFLLYRQTATGLVLRPPSPTSYYGFPSISVDFFGKLFFPPV